MSHDLIDSHIAIKLKYVVNKRKTNIAADKDLRITHKDVFASRVIQEPDVQDDVIRPSQMQQRM